MRQVYLIFGRYYYFGMDWLDAAKTEAGLACVFAVSSQYMSTE